MTVTSRRDVDNAVGGFGGGGGGRWDDDVDDRERQRRHDGRSRGDRNFRQHDARRVGDDDDDDGRRAGRYDKARDDGYHPNARSIPSSTNRHHSTGVGIDNSSIGGGGRIIQLRVLYTHQKTKKKKSWKDGRLTLVGTRCSLYDACPIPGSGGGEGGSSGGAVLDELELSRREAEGLIDRGRRVVDELESDKFLIQVEGPWIAQRDYDDDYGGKNAVDDPLWNKRPTPLASSSRGTTTTNMPSAGHMRVLAIKYRMPSRVLPPHPEERRRRQQRELGMKGGGCAAGSKRSRPLQPGELERMYYGDGGGVGGGGGDFERRGPHRGHPHGGDGRGYDDGHRGNVVVGRGRGGGGGGGMDRDDFRPRDDGGRRDGRQEDDDYDGGGGASRGFHPAAGGDARRRNDEFDDDGRARKDSDEQQQQQRWPTHPTQSQNLHAREVRDDDWRRDAGRHLLPSRTRTDREPCANVAGFTMANYGRWNRSNGRSGDDPGVLGGGKGTTFRSNGYDPSGFYDEEEDSDDEGGVAGDCMGDGRLDPSMDDEADQMYGRTSVRGVIGNSGLPIASQEQRRDGRNNEIRTSGRQPENHPSNRTERREISAGVDHCQAPSTAQDDDPHATDELLALLGAEPAPSTGEIATVPRSSLNSATYNEHRISAGRINDTVAAHDNGDPEKGSQFLAGIIQAEERIHNLAAATTKNNTWRFGGDDSISDGFEGWQEVGNGGFDGDDGGNNDRELIENNDVLHPNNSRDKEGTGATYNLSNSTLPSADESTSSEDEEEEDDNDEQEDF